MLLLPLFAENTDVVWRRPHLGALERYGFGSVRSLIVITILFSRPLGFRGAYYMARPH